MILNGVKTTVVQSSAAALAAGFCAGGAALAAGALTVAAPAVAGAALGIGAFVASVKAYGFIRDAIFRSRVEGLEQHAKSLGLDPAKIVVNCRTDQEGDNFSREHPRLLASLIHDKGLAQWSNESAGDTFDHYRLTRGAVADAKENMSAMAHHQQKSAAPKPEVLAKVMASISDYGISTKNDRGLETTNDGLPSALQAAKATLDRFANRIGVTLGMNAPEVSKQIEAYHRVGGAGRAQPMERQQSNPVLEM